MKWRSNSTTHSLNPVGTKIVLKASEEELKELIKKENARYIIDDGQTQVKPNSLTVVGFFPSSEMEDVVRNFKLL